MAPGLGAMKRTTHMPTSIKFTTSGACSALGGFAPGDVARNVPDALARHLVEEARCAKYLTPAAPAPEKALRPRKPKPAAATPADQAAA